MWKEFCRWATQSLGALVTDPREDGQALVEYALILALVSVVAIALLTTLGSDVVSSLTSVTSAI